MFLCTFVNDYSNFSKRLHKVEFFLFETLKIKLNGESEIGSSIFLNSIGEEGNGGFSELKVTNNSQNS